MKNSENILKPSERKNEKQSLPSNSGYRQKLPGFGGQKEGKNVRKYSSENESQEDEKYLDLSYNEDSGPNSHSNRDNPYTIDQYKQKIPMMSPTIPSYTKGPKKLQETTSRKIPNKTDSRNLNPQIKNNKNWDQTFGMDIEEPKQPQKKPMGRQPPKKGYNIDSA